MVGELVVGWQDMGAAPWGWWQLLCVPHGSDGAAVQKSRSISITKEQDGRVSPSTGALGRDGTWRREHSLLKQKGAR